MSDGAVSSPSKIRRDQEVPTVEYDRVVEWEELVEVDPEELHGIPPDQIVTIDAAEFAREIPLEQAVEFQDEAPPSGDRGLEGNVPIPVVPYHWTPEDEEELERASDSD